MLCAVFVDDFLFMNHQAMYNFIFYWAMFKNEIRRIKMNNNTITEL